jgi:crossover junction endodeoxyribonuclease RuvC
MTTSFEAWRCSPLRILGVDPGLNVTGYAVLDAGARSPVVVEAGVIRGGKGSKRLEMAERLTTLHSGLVEVIEQFRPQALCIEQIYAHYAHPRTAILMGHARGVLLLAGAQRGLTVHSYASTTIKKTITGAGRASKEQMQRAIQRELNLAKTPDPPDVADAIAVALCHCNQLKISD